MKTLTEICNEFGTDKGTKHATATPHCYSGVYDHFFKPYRLYPIKFLEIGVGGGESVQSWLEYFPKAKVYGLDRGCDTNAWNTRGVTPHPRYTFIHGDQTDRTMWKCLLADHGPNFDIIMDDGGHFNDEVITTFEGMWGAVAPGGLYCIEDLAVDTDGSIFIRPGWKRHLEFLSDRIREMNAGTSEIDFVNFTRELAIIGKKGQPHIEPCTEE